MVLLLLITDFNNNFRFIFTFSNEYHFATDSNPIEFSTVELMNKIMKKRNSNRVERRRVYNQTAL